MWEFGAFSPVVVNRRWPGSRLAPKGWMLRGAPFLLSAVLLVLALALNEVRVETVQPTGLTQVTYPYIGYTWALYAVVLGLIAFGVSVNFGQRLARSVLGAATLAVGVIPFAHGVLLLWLSAFHYHPVRCSVLACPPFVEQYFDRIILWSVSAGAGIGLVLAGVWLLFRRPQDVRTATLTRVPTS